MSEIYDITIIGGGPIGLFAGFYAGMRQMKTKVIDSLEVLGGQPAMLYPEKTIYDIPGFPNISGTDLTKNLIKQLNHFDTTICLDEEVISYEKNGDDIFEIKTVKTTHYSKTILIAVGSGAFQPRKLSVDGAENYEGNNLHYLVTSFDDFKDKDVVVVGGGDTAIDTALALEPIVQSVTLVHRRDKFRALESPLQRLKDSSAKIVTPYKIDKLSGKNAHLSAMIFTESRGNKTLKLEADEFIVSYGVKSSLGPLSKWPLNFSHQKISVNEKMETNIPGVYAAGDITNYSSKIDLIATGFGEAPIAVNHAVNYIHPDAKVQPVQSTELDLD